MNNWICYGHLDYYVLIEFELYHCEVNFYPRKVRLDNRLILGLWNLIHSILKICKIESQIHESSNLMKQSFLESIWLFKTIYYFFVNLWDRDLVKLLTYLIKIWKMCIGTLFWTLWGLETSQPYWYYLVPVFYTPIY